jgi:RNA polymerase sigma-70 factor, ECF subfamily
MIGAWSVRLGHGSSCLSNWMAAVLRQTEGGEPERVEAAPDGGGRSAAAESFDALFERWERDVFGYLWRITGDRQLASDLCQETFLRAWQHFDTLRAYEQPRGWLLRVATNLALNQRRRVRTRVGALIPFDDENVPARSDPAWRIADYDTVHQALLALPPRMRAALVLREVHGLSCQEVAQTLRLSLAAAKMTLSRAREQFRQHYRREEVEV